MGLVDKLQEQEPDMLAQKRTVLLQHLSRFYNVEFTTSPPSREGSKAREQRPFHLSVCSLPRNDQLFMKFQQEEPEEEEAVVETVEAFPSFAFRPSVGCMMMPHLMPRHQVRAQ